MFASECIKNTLPIGTLVVFFVSLTGCATSLTETTEEWFVRVANGPGMTDFKFCVSSAPETEDGSNPAKRDITHMLVVCGNSLDRVKTNVVASCEEKKRTKCMPVYYFERGKDEYVLSFEQENMARKAAEERRRQAQAQRAERERLSKICVGYGFKPQTVEHSNCVMKQAQHESQLEAQKQNSRTLRNAERAAQDAANTARQIQAQRLIECINRNNPGETCL